MAEKLLEVKNLRTEFKRDKTWVTAVNNVSFSIQPGEILGLVGESGCGKSVTSLSIMKLLARNSKISNGEILLNGKDLLKEDKKGMRKIRGREVAMIFQEPMTSLNPVLKVGHQIMESILLPYRCNKRRSKSKSSGNDKTGWYSESGRNHGMLSSRAFRWYASAYHDCNGSGM